MAFYSVNFLNHLVLTQQQVQHAAKNEQHWPSHDRIFCIVDTMCYYWNKIQIRRTVVEYYITEHYENLENKMMISMVLFPMVECL